MTTLLQRNEEFVTVPNKCLKIHQPQCIQQLVCEDFVLLELIFALTYACSSIQNLSEQLISCVHHSFLNSALHQNTDTKI
jgi:hypothetical protein